MIGIRSCDRHLPCPDKARIDAAGALHHIIIRGIERKRIFQDDVDRNEFVNRLAHILSETGTVCYAWALLPNHAHLLLRTGLAPIAAVMRRLLTGYAIRYNHRHRRHGQLFQNRYKSILCQEDAYLLELARSLFCYWAVRELGISATSLARLLGLTQPAVSISVKRGQAIAEEKGVLLMPE